MSTLPFRRTAISLTTVLALAYSVRCSAQDREVVCSNGTGSFQAKSFSGVTVRVGAAKNEGMSTRVCEAALAWNSQSIGVASKAAQVDVDAFGVDLGLGVAVAAFQVKASSDQCCVEYKLYSLQKPPRLLRTITGGDSFTAADTDLDGRVEIWTNDAAAISGFERLYLAEFDTAPTVVLRFEKGILLDASSEFRDYFDNQIAQLDKQLKPEDLRDFKNSDGKLSSEGQLSAERAHRLRKVKIKILEIVWSYLYSGRESLAWSSLAEMWPDADLVRIRAAVVEARARGMLAQVSGVTNPRLGKRIKRVRIFDATVLPSGNKPEVNPPEPILLWRPLLPDIPGLASSPSDLLLDLTIDSAGKVRSVEPPRKTTSTDAALLEAATGWKFIPALSAGRPVASRMRMAISSRQ